MLICPLCTEESDALDSDVLDDEVVMLLAAAIRRGDRAEAEAQLDRLLDGNDRCRWAVNRGRFGSLAKAA